MKCFWGGKLADKFIVCLANSLWKDRKGSSYAKKINTKQQDLKARNFRCVADFIWALLYVDSVWAFGARGIFKS